MTPDKLKAIRRRVDERQRHLDHQSCCATNSADAPRLLAEAHADVAALLEALDEHAPPNADLVREVQFNRKR